MTFESLLQNVVFLHRVVTPEYLPIYVRLQRQMRPEIL